MARLFISQERLDAWSAEQRVEIEGDVMTLTDDGRAFKILPAIRFLKVSGGEDDPNDWVNTVALESALDEMGADHYMDSVISGDTAYDVQTGFLGVAIVRERKLPSSGSNSSSNG